MNDDGRGGLPRMEEAERAVLGTFIRWGHLAKLTKLAPDDWYSERHRTIFEAVVALVRENVVVDIVTLVNRIHQNRQLDIAGGQTYLMELSDEVTSAVGWESYEEIILDKSVKRKGIAVARRLNAECCSDEKSAEDIQAEFSAAASALSTSRITRSEMLTTVGDRYFARLENGEAPVVYETGFPSLDSRLKILGSQFGVIAARPGSGKTSAMLQIAANVSRDHGAVLINSLEMSPDELWLSIMAQQTGIFRNTIDIGYDLNQKEVTKLHALRGVLDIRFCYASTPEQLRVEAFDIAARGKLAMVISDYLQLMSPPSPTGNEVQDISYVTRNMKKLGMDMKIPVIGLSQYSREAAKSPRPKISQLRGSGAIEQDANWILSLFPDEEDGDFMGGDFRWWELLKNRGGAQSQPWKMGWHGPTVSFSEYDGGGF